MATQNVNANMIDGIDILTNFKGFSATDSSAGVVALNLKLKEGFRGQVVGDIELSGGINNAFRAHSNIFKFKTTGNLAIIIDQNTIAKVPITPDDYREMRTPTDADADQQGLQTFELPKFLEPTNFIKRKHNGFMGLNYTQLLNKKSKITFSNLFNYTDMVQQSAINQTNIGSNSSNVAFASQKTSNVMLNSTNFKWDYNKSKNTFLIFDFKFTPNADLENDNVLKTNSVIGSTMSNKNFSFGQSLRLSTKLFNKIAVRFLAMHAIENNVREVALLGDLPFFGTNFASVNQQLKIKSNNIAVQTKFSFKSIFGNLSLNILFDQQHTVSQIENSQSIDFYQTSTQIKNRFLTDISWQKHWTSKLNTTFAAKSTTTALRLDNKQNIVPRFEPSIMAQYNFSQVKKATFVFGVNHEFPSLLQLQSGSLVSDFQIIGRRSAVNFDQLLETKEFGLDYLWFGISSQSVFFSKISYSIQENVVTNNVKYNLDFSENNFAISPSKNQFRVLTVYDTKFNKIPFSVKTTAVFSDIKAFSLFNNVLSEMKAENFSVKQQLFSHFKNTICQFEIAYNINQRRTFQAINNFANKALNYQITGLLKARFAQKLTGDISLTRDFQNSGFSTNNVYFLNTNCEYLISRKIKCALTGFNLFNLKTTNIIRTTATDNFFSESINSILPGYLMVGLNYSI